MAAEQALALVVRGTDWSETSRITTLFTREFGKVRALAKGCCESWLAPAAKVA